MYCEVCNKKATQADTILNMWLCDNHYSQADPYKLSKEGYEKLEWSWTMKSAFNKKL